MVCLCFRIRSGGYWITVEVSQSFGRLEDIKWYGILVLMNVVIWLLILTSNLPNFSSDSIHTDSNYFHYRYLDSRHFDCRQSDSSLLTAATLTEALWIQPSGNNFDNNLTNSVCSYLKKLPLPCSVNNCLHHKIMQIATNMYSACK